MQDINVYDPIKVAVGDYPDKIPGAKFGAALATINLQTLWSGVENQAGLYVYPALASTLYISSDSADDDAAAGDGARTVLVSGLDENWNPQAKLVSLAGLAQVAIGGSWNRVFRSKVVTAGAVLGQVGNIYISDSGVTLGVPTGNIYAEITLSYDNPNQTLMALFTVPKGYTALISSARLGVHQDKRTTFSLVMKDASDADACWLVKSVYELRSFSSSYVVSYPVPIQEYTDIEIRVKTEANTENVSATIGYVLSRNRA